MENLKVPNSKEIQCSFMANPRAAVARPGCPRAPGGTTRPQEEPRAGGAEPAAGAHPGHRHGRQLGAGTPARIPAAGRDANCGRGPGHRRRPQPRAGTSTPGACPARSHPTEPTSWADALGPPAPRRLAPLTARDTNVCSAPLSPLASSFRGMIN